MAVRMYMKGEGENVVNVFNNPRYEPNLEQEAIEFAHTEQIVSANFETNGYLPMTMKLFVFDFFWQKKDEWTEYEVKREKT